MSTPPPATIHQRSATPSRDLIHVDLDQQQPHWSQALYECEVFPKVDGSFEFIIEGGSDNGEFPFFGATYHEGYSNVAKDDILLEIQGQKVAGYTQRDVISSLVHSARHGNFVKIKAVKAGYLTKDLRQYLNARFQKGSLDHDLQNTIRDNLYLRTVPCTTRTPRCGEINGVDYTFLSVEEFIALERSGNLLESGIYEGNLYGTPRPAPAASAFSANISNAVHSNGWSPVKANPYGVPKSTKEGNSLHSPIARNNSLENNLYLPGPHASSEGKRRRNRSNVEAMASKTSDVSDYSTHSHHHARSSTPVTPLSHNKSISPSSYSHLTPNSQDDKENSQKPFMGNGQAYFIGNGTPSHWLDPRVSRVPPTRMEDFCDNDLPFGWERIDDPHYGTYYIDHVNRRTQYENPVLHGDSFDRTASTKDFSCRSLSWRSKSEQRSDNSRSPCLRSPCSDTKISPRTSRNSSLTQTTNRDSLTPANTNSFNTIPKQPAFFTRNPDELKGFFIRIPLLKSSRGLGFTIIGGDCPSTPEFLQIKDVVPYGPAWCDGKLQSGDILVFVNNLCVLGYSHKDIVSLFQSIPPGNAVHLEVCRGYPLPFDPNDPNNEIVTTVAVSVANAKGSNGQNIYSTSQPNTNSRVMSSGHTRYMDQSMNRAAKSLPDLSTPRQTLLNTQGNGVINASADAMPEFSGAEYLTVGIIKGTAGFGFTIADSSYGQKVKKILDRPRCKQLQEGDILTEINGQEVQNLPHSDVVQILKDCACGDEAQISVQRGNFPSIQRSKNKPKALDTSVDNIQENSVNVSSLRSSRQVPSLPSNGKEEKFFTGYRSKTPTAELYSSRDKEPVVVPRPKTPLVDSRNWAKSSPIHNTSFDPIERLNPKFDHLPCRESVVSEFKNGAQLDRETTNYLMFDPSHQTVGRNPTWHTNQKQSRSALSNQSFSNLGYLSNPEIYPNISEGQSHSDFSIASPGAFPKLSQDKEHGSLNTENDLGISNKFSESNFNGSETLSSEWPMSVQYKNDAQRVNGARGNGLQNSSKLAASDGNGLFSNQSNLPPNFHFSNSRTKPPFAYSDTTLMKDLYPPTYPQKMNGSTSDGIHHAKLSSSFESEHAAPCNMQNSHAFTYPKNKDSTSENFIRMVVTLYRQNSGFGFRILGGTEEGSQVSVGHIVPGGAADLDGRLQTGDEILGVDGQSVMNSSHRHVVDLMSTAASNGKVTLHIRRPCGTNGNGMSRSLSSTSEVTVSRQENEGFGFVLISSLNRRGSTIGRIIEGSPADRCGQLSIGDVIEAVNGISILNMHHGDIVSLIKDCGSTVTLTINHSPDNSSSITSLSQKGDDSTLDPDDSYHSIELQRGTKGFGFSIRGGREFHNMPLFVLRIAENGPAAQDGRIQVNDQIVEINGVSTKNMTHAEAIDLIRAGGHSVRLLVRRNYHSVDSSGPSHHQNQFLTSSMNSSHSPGATVEPVCQTSA